MPDLDMRAGRTPLREGDVFVGEASPQTVARRIMGRDRVWLVGYPGASWHPTPDPVSKVGPELFRRYFVRQRTWSFGQISVTLLRRVAADPGR